ncbi:MAG: triose-phosphate isomerase [Clostridia bacterium]|nr:triose-phosphate isomerase [Clostridia bacterium]
MKFIFGNWKMNHNSKSCDEYIKIFKKQKVSNVKFGIAVPYVYLEKVSKKLRKNCLIGAQNCSAYEKGAFTGDISASMLKDLGIDFCLVGHSERRTKFFETDEDVNLKIKQLVQNNITPMLCIGETLQQYEAKETKKVLKKQLEKALKNIEASSLKKLIIAYEPVWAIGTGKTADSKTINNIIEYIKKELVKLLGETGSKIKVLYGGSVTDENANELIHNPIVDGALVGGASLDAVKFTNIGRNI